MGVTREEKFASRKLWRRNVIIKLIGKNIGYNYSSKRLQAMWKMQSPKMIIDQPNDFYIVKFTNEEDYSMDLLNVPWMIGGHYLHVQCWRPNFKAETAQIDLIPVQVGFPILPIEYYTSSWLQRAGNKIRRTLKVDNNTFMASRGKFARVCVEIVLNKLLKAIYRLKGQLWKVQYKG